MEAWEALARPRRSQDGPSCDRTGQVTPKTSTRWRHDGPRWRQDVPRWRQDRPRWCQDVPRCAKTGHHEAKTGHMAERAQLASDRSERCERSAADVPSFQGLLRILKIFIGTISYTRDLLRFQSLIPRAARHFSLNALPVHLPRQVFF